LGIEAISANPATALHHLQLLSPLTVPVACRREASIRNRAEGGTAEIWTLVFGYVVTPEHLHFLVSELERELLPTAIRAVKRSVARKLIGEREHFWPGAPLNPSLGLSGISHDRTASRFQIGFPIRRVE
jgi:hypothetical protein